MGTVVLSVDAGLGWRFHDLPDPPVDRIERARDGWRRLVDLLDEYDVPATWGIVGHLFLGSCDGYHHEHPLGASWFSREHTTWAGRPEFRFAPELIDRLLSARVEHDIGCQTFSHVEFDEITQDVARAEMAAFVKATADRGLPFRSFVFPRNSVGHRDMLAEWGFSCYRGAREESNSTGSTNRSLRALSQATVSAPPLVTPEIDEYGLVNVPASLDLFGAGSRLRRLSNVLGIDPDVKRARRGIERAATEDGVFHAYLRADDVGTGANADRLRSVLECVDTRREAEDLAVRTMADVAERVRQTPPSAISPQIE